MRTDFPVTLLRYKWTKIFNLGIVMNWYIAYTRNHIRWIYKANKCSIGTHHFWEFHYCEIVSESLLRKTFVAAICNCLLEVCHDMNNYDIDITFAVKD